MGLSWVVCGAPRSGTSAMVEFLVRWTTIPALWNLEVEDASQRQNRRANRRSHDDITRGSDGHIVKVLEPSLPVEPAAVVLMRRDPEQAARSARKLGQLIEPADIEERVAAFRERWPAALEVWMCELADESALAAKLAAGGWPIERHPSPLVSVRSQR